MSSSSDVHTRERADERRERRSEKVLYEDLFAGRKSKRLATVIGEDGGLLSIVISLPVLSDRFYFPPNYFFENKIQRFLKGGSYGNI